jgi:N-methylhydantoinase A
MVAFGGAGPLHACRLARAIGAPRVIVPYAAGVGSAIGLLVADHKVDTNVTRIVKLGGESRAEIAEIVADLESRAQAEAKRLRHPGELLIERSAYMHHVGQGYEIRVVLPSGPVDETYEKRMLERFYEAYKREYGYVDQESAVEVTDWFVIGTVPSSSRGGISGNLPDAPGGAIVGERQAYFPETGGMTPTKVINRYNMTPSDRFEGPALVEERESTTVVLPGDVVSVSAFGHLVIDINIGR